MLLCLLDSRAHESYPAKNVLISAKATEAITSNAPLRGANALTISAFADAPETTSYATFALAVAAGEAGDLEDGAYVRVGSTWYRHFSAATRAGGLVPKYPFGDSRVVTAVEVIEAGITGGTDPRDAPGFVTTFSAGSEGVDWSITQSGTDTRFARFSAPGTAQLDSAQTLSASDTAVVGVVHGVTVANTTNNPVAWFAGAYAYATASTAHLGGAYVAPAVSPSNWCHRTGASTYEDSGISFSAGDTVYAVTDSATARLFSVASESGDNASVVHTGSGTVPTIIGFGYPTGSGTTQVDVSEFAVYRLTLSS